MVVEMTHGSGEVVKVIANPVKMSATPADYRSAPPILGEHSQHVLCDILGMSAAEVAALRERGIV
jgi:crotonobetainyl-CoA:carnitine CoA-transferase CaiB-like acyl-CoA transferase